MSDGLRCHECGDRLDSVDATRQHLDDCHELCDDRIDEVIQALQRGGELQQ